MFIQVKETLDFLGNGGLLVMNILHLSDLHFGTETDAKIWYSQLAEDLIRGLKCKHVDILIISGDIANKSVPEEYTAAQKFLELLSEEFKLIPKHIVIVPGNHDLNWQIAEQACIYEGREENKSPTDNKGNPDKNYAIDRGRVVEIQNPEKYKQRFKNFIAFYESVTGAPYPLNYEEQARLYHFPKWNLLILGLNSAWQIDHHYRSRAGIKNEALSNALDQIRRNPGVYEQCRKFAVWHHPLNSPGDDRITDTGFMQRLAQSGFRIALHGHIHKAENSLYRYDRSVDGRKIESICAGTFGAPARDWVPGHPLQYNLLRLNEKKLIVESRCRRKPNGAWMPDAIWTQVPGKDPLPRYEIDLPSCGNHEFDLKTKERTSEPGIFERLPHDFWDKEKDEIAYFFKKNFSEIKSEIQSTQQMVRSYKDSGDNDGEFQSEIDYAKELMEKSHSPSEAYNYLEKLKNRIWDKASEKSKYRILTNMGSAKIDKNELNEGAYLLIQAYQYDQKSENALTNAAFAHSLLKEYNTAQKFLEKALAKNPYNTNAHSIKIDLLFEKGQKINEIIEQIPEHLMNKKEIAVSIAQKALSQKKFKAVEECIERIEKKDRDTITDEILGNSIIAQIESKLGDMAVDMLEESDKEKLRKAIGLLEVVWNKYKSSEMRTQKVYCLTNMGIAESILGNNERAKGLFLLAKMESPEDPNIKKNLGLIYLKTENFQKSIGYFEELTSYPEFVDVNLLLGQLYYKSNQFSKSEVHLKKILDSPNIDDQLLNEALILMVEIYSKEKRWSDAEALYKYCNNKVLENLIASRILKEKDQRDEAIKKLKIAKQELEKKPMNFYSAILGIEFQQFREFQDAIDLFEKVANKNTNSEITQRLLLCYYYEGKLDKVLELSKNLRGKHGPLVLVTEIEINVYGIIGDLNRAEELYKEFIHKYPEQRMAIIHYAFLQIRLQKINEAKRIATDFIEKFNLKELQENEIIATASLFNSVGKFHDAVNLVYDGLKKYPNKQEMHEKYFSLLLVETKDDNSLQVEKVGVDAAVKIKDEKDEIHWKIIENENPDFSKSEISDDTPLAKELIGKKVGDRILFKDSTVQPEFGKIEEIMHKYIYKLHHEVLRNYETNFHSNRAIHSIHVDINAPKLDRNTKGFDVIFNMLDKKEKSSNEIVRHYVDDGWPVGAVSNLLSVPSLKFFLNLIYDPKVSINSCRGTLEERKVALSTLNKNSKLIADITSIITISELGIWDIVTEEFGKITIIQEIKDELHHVLQEFEDSRLKYSICKENGENFRHEGTESERKEALKFFRGIDKSLEKYCEVMPCNGYVSIEPKERDNWEKILGNSFYKTVLLTSEIDNGIHYSDDMALREFGFSEYQNSVVWTQALLMYLLHVGKLNYNEYSDLTLELITMGFKHTGIDGTILFTAAQKTNWSQKPPFSKACEFLSGNYSDESSLHIAVDFLFRLWDCPSITNFRKNNFTQITLESLLKGRDRTSALKKLKPLLVQKFFFHPFYLNEIMQTLKVWQGTRLL